MKTNEQISDEMGFIDVQRKPIKNYSLDEMIKIAKQSEYGCVWYSERGPIQITKEGNLVPLMGANLRKSKEILDRKEHK